MIATEQYLIILLFTRLLPTLGSMQKIFKGDHSNESYRAALSCGTAVQYINCTEVGLNFEPVNLMKTQVVTAQVNSTEQFVPAVHLSIYICVQVVNKNKYWYSFPGLILG